MPLMTHKPEFKQIAAGTYYAVIASIAPKTIPDGKGGETSGAEWKFTIHSDGPHYGDTAERFTSLAWSPRSTCYQWATALLGQAPDPEEPMDIEQFVGHECYIIVAQDPNKPERTKVTSLQRVIRDVPPPPPPARPAQAPQAKPAPAQPAAAAKGKAKAPAAPPPLPPEPDDEVEEIDF
jgi:hypothetical protein